MSYFRRPDAPLDEQAPAEDLPRSPFAEVAGRFANWITGVDHMPPGEEFGSGEAPDLFAELTGEDRTPRRAERPTRRRAAQPMTERRDEHQAQRYAEPPAVPEAQRYTERPAEPEAQAPPEAQDNGRFPMAAFGYNRAAVDEHLAELERELTDLRAQRTPRPSITEELERIGEQTASILVVAHDQANETTRLAQEQAVAASPTPPPTRWRSPPRPRHG